MSISDYKVAAALDDGGGPSVYLQQLKHVRSTHNLRPIHVMGRGGNFETNVCITLGVSNIWVPSLLRVGGMGVTIHVAYSFVPSSLRRLSTAERLSLMRSH
jgi:hypothetical protein